MCYNCQKIGVAWSTIAMEKREREGQRQRDREREQSVAQWMLVGLKNGNVAVVLLERKKNEQGKSKKKIKSIF